MENTATQRSRPAALSATLSLTNRRFFAIALVLMIAPLWFGAYLPMVDLPQHAAQVTALKEIWAGNPLFTGLFEVNWFTPYLLGYMTLYVLSLVFPITVATQIMVSLALVSVPVLTGSLLRAAGADERWRWLAIPCAFGFAFHWGFLSFLVAVPFALLFFIRAICFAERPTLRNAIILGCFSLFLFFCHVIALGFASAVSVSYVACRYYGDLKTLSKRLLPFAMSLPLIVMWILVTHEKEASVRSDPVIYGSVLERLIELFVQPAGGDSLSLINALVFAAILLVPAIAGGQLSRQPARWVPCAVGLLLFVLVPRFVLSTAYVFHRLGIFLVPLWLMAWDPPQRARSRNIDWAVMLVVVVWTLTNVGRFAAFAGETRTFQTVMAQMEPGRRVGSLLVSPWSANFSRPVYLHFVAWYQAERAGVVDFNSANFLPQMVRYRDRGAAPRINEFLAWNPTAFRWERDGGNTYDYFLVKAPADLSAEIFKDKHQAVELVARSGWWWLYRNKEARPLGSPHAS